MNILDHHTIYNFSSKYLSSTVQAYMIDESINHLKLIKGQYQGIDFPLIFQLESKKKLLDIVDTGYAGFFLISDKTKAILDQNHLTGWKTFPIKLYGKNGNEIKGYHGFSIIGHCSPTNYIGCEIIEKRIVSNGPICRFYKGVSISDWDGSDFFTPDGTYETFISKKAADALIAGKVSNLRLENLADSETDMEDIMNANF